MTHRSLIALVLSASLPLSGCAGMGSQADTGFMYKNLPVATSSAEPGEGQGQLPLCLAAIRFEPKLAGLVEKEVDGLF